MTRDDEGGTVAKMAKKSAKKRNARTAIRAKVRRSLGLVGTAPGLR